jgi:hypothetical protein
VRCRLLVLATALAALLAACGGGGGTSSDTAAPSGSTEAAEATGESGGELSYPIVQTGETDCYTDVAQIECPAAGEPFSGQDGDYRAGAPVSYTDNGDGTVTDDSTGLMWQRDPGEKTTYAEAVEGAGSLELAGYDDWRLPTIKELYSLILFSGTDASTLLNQSGADTSGLTPFIDTEYFDFSYGDEGAGERIIDAQWTTSTVYESTVFGGQECFFGVNFADGRIKCYPTAALNNGWYTYHVRDTGEYGVNDFADNGDGTIADSATGLTWEQADSGEGFDWEAALGYCDGLELGGANDWRLPNAKELQSIVDYSRSPDTTESAAIDPVFETSSITNEAGEPDFPFFWTSTTHLSYPDNATEAAYVVFGRGFGYFNGSWIDVHGAGSQRSDPKTGDASEFPEGRGPQGDAIRIDNYARCVRGG